jgi:hypothetical protein
LQLLRAQLMKCNDIAILQPNIKTDIYLWGAGIDQLVLGTGCGLDKSSSKVKNFLVFKSSRLVLVPTQPPFRWVPRVKEPGRKADRSPPTSVEV